MPSIPRLSTVLVALSLCTALNQPAAQAAAPLAGLDLKAASQLPDLVEKVLPGVVNISSTSIVRGPVVIGMEDFFRGWGIPQEQKQTSLGSGFLIDKDGFILTNNHVVEHSDEVIVTLIDKRSFRAKIIGKDEKMDLALIQIRDKDHKVPGNLQPVALGDSDAVRIAEPALAIGNPFGLQHTVTMGIISAKNRTIGIGPFDNFLQTDASINPGNSGGPLFNLKGEVIGINTVIFSKTQQSAGLGFAIPVNEAKKIQADLKRYGRIPRPWLGVLGQRIVPQLAEYYELPVDKGVFVSNLVEKGPADRSGIHAGDIIVTIDGMPAEDNNDIERQLAKHKPTDVITVSIRRGRKKMEIPIHLGELPKLENLPQGII